MLPEGVLIFNSTNMEQEFINSAGTKLLLEERLNESKDKSDLTESDKLEQELLGKVVIQEI